MPGSWGLTGATGQRSVTSWACSVGMCLGKARVLRATSQGQGRAPEAPGSLGCHCPARRSSSVFMERELTLDGAIVSAVFHDSMDMGVAGSVAGTLWYINWAEGTSTHLISGHRSKVRPPGRR